MQTKITNPFLSDHGPRTTDRDSRSVIRVGHSPDADDAFMFYAIKYGKVKTGGLKLVDVIEDIESLNHRAINSELEVTAMSLHAYAYAAKNYDIMTCGVSMGDGYGPVVVTKARNSKFEIRNSIAVPGRLTTAYLLLKLWNKNWKEIQFLPFDKIIPAVKKGTVDAGLIIHEGQIRFKEFGLTKLVDLGEWWMKKTKLPAPLGIDAVRKDLGSASQKKLTRILKDSIQYALEHRKPAIQYSMKYGRGMKTEIADRFVGMYVNDWTIDMGPKGKRAVRELLKRGAAAGLIPKVIPKFI
ncbi:MAG: ABC transporter substrate-binding protein [Candidatus Omnitrophica bacterium]|nr:ABC transporter substrate-binding protein [Candidatus Omnitrophota bacterium]